MEKKGVGLYLYLVVILILLIAKVAGPVQYFIDWNVTLQYAVDSALIITVALAFLGLLNRYVMDYALRKLLRYIILIFVIVIIYFTLQDRIIAVSISLGILTAVLVFIFQTPLLSLIGWVYLMTGRVYKVGDRISIGNIKGDVIHINPIRTKVLEVGGDYVLADLPSGRVFTFPNAQLLSEPVSNYTMYLPYIWVAIPFHLTYETDFRFVMRETEKIILKHLEDEEKYMKKEYKKLLEKYNIVGRKTDLVNFNIKPFQSWIEFRAIFPLDPKKQSLIITSVTQEILKMFNKYPSKIRFPRGRSR
jgi:small-conductance mechanosensitive channel